MEGDGVQGGAEVVVHLGHERRVEGVRDGQLFDAQALARQLGGDLGERLGAARDHALVGGVGRGERQVRVGFEERQDVFGGGGDRGHAALRAHGLHEAGAGGHQRDGVGEAEEPGDGGGRGLADAVPDEHVRAHAPGHPQLGERVLEGEQGGLGVLGAVDRLGVLGRADDQVAYGAAECGGEEAVARVDVPAEDREALVQVGAHARVLRALPAEHEGDLADARGALVVAVRGLVQELGEGGAVGDRAREAVRVVGAGDVAGVAERVDGRAGSVSSNRR